MLENNLHLHPGAGHGKDILENMKLDIEKNLYGYLGVNDFG